MICILLVIITSILTWKYADWRNWKNYHSSMLFIMLGNLFYGFVYHDRFLWQYEKDIFNPHLLEIIMNFTVLPLTILIFLSNFPVSHLKQFFKIVKYVLVYIIVELILYYFGMIHFSYGWNLGYSLAWDFIMFTILAVHFKKPLRAYGISLLVIFLMNIVFPFKLD